MRFVLRSKDLSSLSFGFHWLKTRLSLGTKELFNQVPFGLLNVLIVILESILFPLEFFFHLFSGLSGLDVTNHAVQISEERFGVIVDVAFFLIIDSKVIGLFDICLIDSGCLTVEVLDFEFHHDFGDVFVDLFDEGGDGFGVGVEFVETAQVMDESDELIMDFALVFGFFLLFGDLSVEDFQELGFEEHLM